MQSFQNMVTDYQQRVDKAEQQQVEKVRERWWLKSELLHELCVNGRTKKGEISKVKGKKVKNAWPDPGSEDELETGLDHACQEALAGNIDPLSEDEIESLRVRAKALCIGLEFIAGLPSPEEDREQRMKYQVDRLAESMSGEITRKPVADEALDAEKSWLGMYQLPAADFEAFGSRVKQALTAIKGNT